MSKTTRWCRMILCIVATALCTTSCQKTADQTDTDTAPESAEAPGNRSPAAATGARSATPVPPPQRQRIRGPGELYAFLVGVRQYDRDELTSLRFSENDIGDLAEALRTSGYPDENIVLMTQKVGAYQAHMAPFAENFRRQFGVMLGRLQP